MKLHRLCLGSILVTGSSAHAGPLPPMNDIVGDGDDAEELPDGSLIAIELLSDFPPNVLVKKII